MRGRESHTVDPRHVRDGCDKSCKIPVAESVGIDVLSKEGDLLESLSAIRRASSNDSLWIPGAFTPARIGDHTETAEVVAASHDGDPGVYPVDFGRVRHRVGFIFRKVHCESLLMHTLFL